MEDLARIEGGIEACKYWAFLSYSHADKKWADWLHKSLERYRVPKRLVGRESHDGHVPARIFPVFRDREELAASADLGGRITEALAQSRYLLVICSPAAAGSRWVGEEIKAFKKLGREDRVRALIVDGEPNSGGADECFPAPLRYELTSTGDLSEVPAEHVAADARPEGDGRENALLKLIAGLLDVRFDELRLRDQARRIARLRAIISGALLLVLLFAVLGVALFLQRNRALAQEALARRNQLAAEQSRDQAESLVGYLTYTLREQLEPIGRLNLLDGVVVELRKYYANLPADAITPGRLRLEATAFVIEGDLAAAQGDLDPAVLAYRRALDLARKLAERAPDNLNLQRDVSLAHGRIAEILLRQNKAAEAEAAYREALKVFESLAATELSNLIRQYDLSLSYINVADALRRQGRYAEALELTRKAVEIRQRLVQAEPDSDEWQAEMAVAYSRLGDILSETGAAAGAIEAFRSALKIDQEIAAKAPEDAPRQRRLSISYDRLGDYFRAAARWDEAREHYHKSLAIIEALAAQDPANADWQSDLSVSYDRIGDTCFARQQWDKALVEYRRSLDIRSRLADKAPANRQWQRSRAISQSKIGGALAGAAHIDEAEEAFRQALEGYIRIAEEDSSDAPALTDLVFARFRLGSHLIRSSDSAKREEGRRILQLGQKLLMALDEKNMLTAAQKKWVGMFQQALASAEP